MESYQEIVLRAIFSYLCLFILTKLMGKREISQMTFFDYVVGITIGSIAANITLNLNNDFLTMLPALVIFALFQILNSVIALKSKTFRKLVEGQQTTIIENGQINERHMAKERLNIDELLSMLRQQSIFDLNDVEDVYFENNGRMSVKLKTNKQPVTPSDINLTIKRPSISRLIIENGQINLSELQKIGYTKSYLMKQLNAFGIQSLDEVMFAQIDDQGKLYLDQKENGSQN
jgi:uncharacterized membrane protein YcaP (DUF421 family)